MPVNLLLDTRGGYMKTVQAVISLPEDLYLSLSCFGLTREIIVSESRKLLTLKYFQEKLLSLGKAAELSGLSRWNFIEYLSSNNVPVIDYDDDEISREFETAENISEVLALSDFTVLIGFAKIEKTYLLRDI